MDKPINEMTKDDINSYLEYAQEVRSSPVTMDALTLRPISLKLQRIIQELLNRIDIKDEQIKKLTESS